MPNKFLNKVLRRNTYTENGALSNASTNSGLLDYFSKAATFRDRELKATFAEVSRMWAESPDLALKIIFYLRLITRKTQGFKTSETVQKGQGNRSEFRNAIIWLARYQPDALYRNLQLIPIVGSWKDLWHIDLIHELDHDKVYDLIERGLKDDYNRPLLAKYLPRIRSRSNTYNERHYALNDFAKGLCKQLGWSPVKYRKFKSSGMAHDFQRKMSASKWHKLNFNGIPGKALYQLVNNVGREDKFTTLQRHGIEERYIDWIQAQPTAKFTGYVYELMKAVTQKANLGQRVTVNKQFDGLIELARQDRKIIENVWCALDTSGSMGITVANTTAYDICVSLGIYFSTLNEGTFKDNVILFDNVSSVKQLHGTFSDKVMQIRKEKIAWGSTNFQSVIDEIVRVRRDNPDIPLADYPSTLLVVSDMQFNPVGKNTHTNYEAAMKKLADVGLPKMRIVWWWVTGRATDFPSTFDDEGVIMIGGFDGAIISNLLGQTPEDASMITPQKSTSAPVSITPYEAMLMALDQEVLNMIN